MRTKVRTRLLKFTMAMEIVMAITILGAILASIALLICGSVEKFCCQWESFSIDAFMANAFLIVMGIEFVKMLMLHTYGAVIDVLLFAIARQMIISHEEPMQTLMSVGAVAGIFAIKKYLYTGERWESDDAADASGAFHHVEKGVRASRLQGGYAHHHPPGHCGRRP